MPSQSYLKCVLLTQRCCENFSPSVDIIFLHLQQARKFDAISWSRRVRYVPCWRDSQRAYTPIDRGQFCNCYAVCTPNAEAFLYRKSCYAELSITNLQPGLCRWRRYPVLVEVACDNPETIFRKGLAVTSEMRNNTRSRPDYEDIAPDRSSPHSVRLSDIAACARSSHRTTGK